MALCYRIILDTVEIDDDAAAAESGFTIVHMCHWIFDESVPTITALGGRGFDVSADAVRGEEEGPTTLEAKNCLTELGVEEKRHGEIIIDLINYIKDQVIISNGCPPAVVTIDIVAVDRDVAEASTEELESHIREALRLSIENMEFEEEEEEEEERLLLSEAAAIIGIEMMEKLQPCRAKQDEASLSCVICMEEEEDGEADFKQMPCEHVFHGNCITVWLGISPSCPLCRYSMKY